MRRMSDGPVGFTPNSCPASMIASYTSVPLVPSVRYISYPISDVHPVRVMTTGAPAILASVQK